MVGAVRRSLADSASDTRPRMYTTKHGTVATISTADIVRPADDADPICEPEATTPQDGPPPTAISRLN